MDRWRKNHASKPAMLPRVSSIASNSTRRNAKEETSLLKLRKQRNGEPSNRGSMWMPKDHNSRKSIPRRLSYSRHDDSISLMNINPDDTLKSTPMKPERVPDVKVSNVNETKKKVIEDDEEIGVKKETLEYLKSIGIIGGQKSQQKCKSPRAPTNVLSAAKRIKTIDSTTKSIQKNENVENLQNAANHCMLTSTSSLQQKVKELLKEQMKEKSELRKRYEEEIKMMEKSHYEKLIGLFSASGEEIISKPPAITVTTITMSENHLPQDLNISQDSFLNSPFSGAWKVANINDDDFSNTPTLGLNSVSNMTINGQQYLDTPATRRLVAQRITQGIETLLIQ